MADTKQMSLWEWDLITAALQYYERGRNITSSSFPADVIRNLWADPDRSPSDLRRIAMQFVDVYHCDDNATFWDGYDPVDADPWILFYEFCKGYAHGFADLVLRVGGPAGSVHRVRGFLARLSGRSRPSWYSVDDYLESPVFPFPIDEAEVMIDVESPGAFRDYESKKA